MKKLISCIALALAAGIILADEVSPLEASIAKGAKYLLANQQADGHFSDAQMPALTALPLWALSGCGDTSETVVEAKKKADNTPIVLYNTLQLLSCHFSKTYSKKISKTIDIESKIEYI